jgi:hypothetical protein
VAANIAQTPAGAGSTASTSLVHFSGGGTPETWAANDYVYLTPGDGEDIQAIATWRELLFIFKQTKFFVFYGNSVDSGGDPVFNYRVVDTGIGAVGQQAVTAGPEGVYFVDRRGIYVTTGATPTLVSEDVDPLFLGGGTDAYTGGLVNPGLLSSVALQRFSGRLYMSFQADVGGRRLLVLDPATRDWLLWNMPVGAMAAVGSTPARLLFTYAAGTNNLGVYAPHVYSDDAGTPIPWFYRSGFYTTGNSPSQEMTVRETILDGQGTVTLSVARDFEPAPTSGGGAKQAVALGTAPLSGQGRHDRAQKGRRFSYQLEGTGPAKVNSLTHHIPEVRSPGLETDAAGVS